MSSDVAGAAGAAADTDDATACTAWDGNDEINIFREYLRIPSVQPNVNYGMYLPGGSAHTHPITL